jgi:alpha-ketoglutarate-dependent taurine dioxygenase
VADSARFRRVATALARCGLRDYAGGASPRRTIGDAGGPVYTSTDYPPHLTLPLHNELSYSATHPDRIYFGCLVAPSSGGATTLGDSRRILEAMPAAIRDAFEAKGVQYIRLLSPEKGSGYSWQDAFRSDDRAELERRCGDTGAQWEWLENGFVRIIERRPALARHPVTGEAVWFNQAAGFHPAALDPAVHAELIRLHGDESRFRLNVRFGDGSLIPAETIREVAAVIAREALPHAWQAGDVLMLDNLLNAHGRAPFRGERRIAVAMS